MSFSRSATTLGRRLVWSVTAIALLVSVAGCGGDSPRTLVGYQIEPRPTVDGSTLPDVTAGDAPFTLRAASGGALLVFFGYTSCPDICPATLSNIRAALRRLDAAQTDRVQVAMITVDPARDTPERLGQYVTGIVDGGHGLRTDDPAALRSVATRFGADYVVETDEDGTTNVSHTSVVYVIDDAGSVELAWPFGVTSADMANDLDIVLSGGA